ncbi:MAG TPA: superoxide dismutase [Nocardioidaceae bacterium]|nr:superoxide dismutase [Nocardioidaceae bacterium]
MTISRTRWSVALAALLVPLLPGPAAGKAVPNRIDLPDGWQPEGITTDGTWLYAGSLANGAIWKTNPQTGKGRLLAKGQPGRVAVGVEYDARRNLVWVAGGPTQVIRAHSARTGALRATYSFPTGSRFVNDLVVTRRGVFATDSQRQELLVVPFRKDGSLRRPRAARTLTLTGDLVYEEGFNLNGIVRYRGRLLAVQSNTGLLFRINKGTGVNRVVDTGGYSLDNGDGLEIRRDKLFVVRNQDELVAVLDLNRRATKATLKRELHEPSEEAWDIPTTAALQRGNLWVVNARFGTPPTPTTDYWISRVAR